MITVDNWVEVHNVLSGQVVGSIQAVFAIGRESQIAAFLDRTQVLSTARTSQVFEWPERVRSSNVWS